MAPPKPTPPPPTHECEGGRRPLPVLPPSLALTGLRVKWQQETESAMLGTAALGGSPSTRNGTPSPFAACAGAARPPPVGVGFLGGGEMRWLCGLRVACVVSFEPWPTRDESKSRESLVEPPLAVVT